MDQIIIGGVKLPEAPFDGYSCWEDNLSVHVDMITGRRVAESRGNVWRVSYTSDYIEDPSMSMALAVLRTKGPFIANVLTPGSDELYTARFLVDSYTPPSLLAFDGSTPVWHGLSFTLREEKPH